MSFKQTKISFEVLLDNILFMKTIVMLVRVLGPTLVPGVFIYNGLGAASKLKPVKLRNLSEPPLTPRPPLDFGHP